MSKIPSVFIGFENLGNTCFINTCIQILLHTPEISNCLLSKPLNKPIPERQVCFEWINILNKIKSIQTDSVLLPRRFIFSIQKVAKEKNRDIFSGWAQNDFTEFLYFLMDCFHNTTMQSIELKILGKAKNNKDRIAIECYKHLQDLYKKEFSEIIHYFYGIYVNEIISIDGSVIHSLKPESFFILDLEMPSQSTKINLHDCLEQYIKEEKMMGENSWFNEKTLAREDIIKKISFWSFPKVLIFSLKRFINENHKSNTIIDFPINDLDLNIYIKGYNNNRKYIYDLYAICNHMGNNHNGHYFTFIKRENKWFCYDDSKITEIKESNIITPYVYCLFYRQKI